MILQLPRRFQAIVLAIAATVALVVFGGNTILPHKTATVIPVPNPLVTVTTDSGSIHRTWLVPIGGVPVPMDVSHGDGLSPDITGSVGLIAANQLPGKPIVPTITVARLQTAVVLHQPNLPLKIDFNIDFKDAGNGLKELATIHYGFETPPGGLIPQLVQAQLVGPIQGGFINPLEAIISAPGYNAPLKFNVRAITSTFDGTFGLGFDPLPEQVHFIMAPRSDGLDFHYDHTGPHPDIKLAASADILQFPTCESQHFDALIERLPNSLDLHDTTTTAQTTVEYQSESVLAKPDIQANYRDTLLSGQVVTDANFQLAGFPAHIKGVIGTSPNATGGQDVNSVNLQVLDGAKIDSVAFAARNWIGDPLTVPVVVAGIDPYISAVTRTMADSSERFRIAGRVEDIRSVQFTRTGVKKDGIDLRTDVGNGVKPLRAIVDLDNRGPGAPTDAKRLNVDTTIRPLPAQIHTLYEPGTDTAPTHILYESSASADIFATALIAESTGNACGQLQVTCATTSVYKIPSSLDLKLPAHAGTDFSIVHNAVAPAAPDLTAVVDKTGTTLDSRTWANVTLLRIPNTVTGRLDAQGGVVRAAEFHGCNYDFVNRVCLDTQQAIGRVRFTVRNQPSRGSLPPPPDTVPTFVTMLKRDADFEISGQVDEVRNVVFHQRVGADGKATGTLGALVDIGKNPPLDVVVDQVKDSKTTQVFAKVRNLPTSFSACYRDTAEVAPPHPFDPADPNNTNNLSNDPLLNNCETTTNVVPAAGEHAVTPLSVYYTSAQPTDVTADVTSSEPSPDDGGLFHTKKLHTHVGSVPLWLSADVISPINPETTPTVVAGRRLQVLYQAASTVDMEFSMESRRTQSVCTDPRPSQQATCFSANLHGLPSRIAVTYDPDPSKGDIDVQTAPPTGGALPLSIDNIVLSKVSEEANARPLVVTGKILGITPHLVGKLVQMDTDDPPSGQLSLAKVSFNACPNPLDTACAGIKLIDVTATNTPITGLFTPPAPDPDVTHFFSFIQLGKAPNSLFQAHASIGNLKEISYSKIGSDGLVSKATTVRAAFADPGGGPTPKLQAYINRDLGDESELVSAVIDKVPTAIEMCFRGRIAPEAPKVDTSTISYNYCEKAASDKLAIQAHLTSISSTQNPDIEVRQFRMTKGGGASKLNGTFKIFDLGARVDVLVGNDDSGKMTDLLVEGHNFDGSLGNVVGRATFDIKNYDGTGTQTGFPYQPISNTDQEPGLDTRNNDPAGKPDPGTNYIEMLQNIDAVHAFGSVPAIQRIFMAKDRCNTTDQRFPDANAFPSAMKPDYTCINAQVAQDRPLGFAIRTLDVNGGALAVDEGHIDSVPGGAGGITAALTSVPDTLKLSPACHYPSDLSQPNAPEFTPPLYCRPPLLSVSAPKSAGQKSVLEARIGIGPADLINTTRGTSVLDPGTAARVNLEAHPRDLATHDANDNVIAGSEGARVKIGTRQKAGGGTDVGLSASMNIALPNFLDIDQPTAYSCRRDSAMNGCAADPKVYSDKTFKGFNAGDTFFKLVAANSGHDGHDVDYLGRVAMLYHNFDDGSQIYLGGIPDGDNSTGGTPYTQENMPPPGPYDLGAQLPGHLDLQIYTRDQFESPQDGKVIKYIQVDGRINKPLTMGIQVETSDGALGATRNGTAVPALMVGLRNAPGLDNNVTDFSQPTFRVRAEIDKKHGGPPGFFDCGGAGIGIDLGIFNACILTPNPTTHWLDVNMNAFPGSNPLISGYTPGAPARTIDAMVDQMGGDNEVELRGWANVQDTGPKGAVANFTPQAALRMDGFDIGLKAGIDLLLASVEVTFKEQGDVILNLLGEHNTRLRLSQDLGAMRVVSEGGKSDVNINDLANIYFNIHTEEVFGVFSQDATYTSSQFHQGIGFNECVAGPIFNPFGSTDHFDVTNDNTKAAISFDPVFIPTDAPANAADVFAAVSKVLIPIWCLVSTNDGELVNSNAGHPAPAFDEPGRPITGVASITPPAPPPPPPPPAPIPNITVDAGNQTFCGVVQADTLHVTGTGHLLVGQEGTHYDTVTTPTDGSPPVTVRHDCNGSLEIHANHITVDNGGTISADAKRVSAGAGQPGDAGGGAGHAGTGGASGLGGSGGGTYGDATQAAINDFGSAGQTGSDGVAGGAGAGTLRLGSADEITINGRVSADGGGGAGNGGDCTKTGGGGGSGGAISLSANRVTVGATGAVSASGGTGGGGANGGGGGGGGRVAIYTAVKTINGSLVANGVGGGGAGSGCTNGGGGNNGNAGLGVTLARVAGVTFTDPNQGPYDQGTVKVHYNAIQSGGGPLNILICHGFEPSGTANPFGQPGIDPPTGSGALTTILSSGGCTVVATTSVGDSYSGDVTLTLADGYYGFYALAAKPPVIPPTFYQNCLSIFDFCTYQDPLPTKSTITITSDATVPTVTSGPVSGNGTAGCPGGSLCLGSTTGKILVTASDATSGIAPTGGWQCSVNGAPTQDCTPSGGVSLVQLGNSDGSKAVTIFITDLAGNTRTVAGPTWFVDRTPPTVTVSAPTYSDGAGLNGWHNVSPDISATATDPGAASGFGPNPITFYTDEATNSCGGPAPGNPVTCSSATLHSLGAIPAEGIHAFKARAVDKLGNQSGDSNTVTMKVDKTPATSVILYGPGSPDGPKGNGWYVTQPFFAFAAADTPGGSGVDPTVAPSGVYWQLDGSNPLNYTKYDPTAANLIPDGTHFVTWYSVDVAGNHESTHTSANIFVDSHVPVATEGISPATPTGSNSWYLSKPTITPAATDFTPGSSLDRVEYQIDNGPWTLAPASFLAPEGDHFIRTRAFDVAGNKAALVEREVRVDLSTPTARAGSYPPNPNLQGWFRELPMDFGSSSDGRDAPGIDVTQYSIDGGPWFSYLAPFTVPNGVHNVQFRSRDLAGVYSPVLNQLFNVDIPPATLTPSAVAPSPILLPILFPTTQLTFDAEDPTAPRVNVTIQIYNALGVDVRNISAATSPDGYRPIGPGAVTWDGKDYNGNTVLPGVYYYRVEALSQSGNSSISTESPTFLVLIAGVPTQ